MISIITTVRNGEIYILDTLKSVQNQTFHNFEHIVVDDGSTDATVSILKNFKKQNTDYNLHIYQPGSLGRGRALNFAISKTNYDWLAIIDADDIWHPQKLEIQAKIIIHSKIDVLATGGKLFTNIGEINTFKSFDNYNYDIEYPNKSDMIKSNSLSHSSVLMKKEVVNYDENRKSQFDYELWLRLIAQGHIVARLKLPLNYHRIHKNQSFESKMRKGYRWRAFKLKIKYLNIFKEPELVLYITFKLVFDLIFPRRLRFKIKDKLKANKI